MYLTDQMKCHLVDSTSEHKTGDIHLCRNKKENEIMSSGRIELYMKAFKHIGEKFCETLDYTLYHCIVLFVGV